jgi:hypothetical protein
MGSSIGGTLRVAIQGYPTASAIRVGSTCIRLQNLVGGNRPCFEVPRFLVAIARTRIGLT